MNQRAIYWRDITNEVTLMDRFAGALVFGEGLHRSQTLRARPGSPHPIIGSFNASASGQRGTRLKCDRLPSTYASPGSYDVADR
jgi:hypothetical protein